MNDAPSPTQERIPDTGLICLTMIMRLFGLPADMAQLRHRFAPPDGPMGTQDLLRCAKALELKAQAVTTTWDRLPHTPLPAMARHRNGH